MGKLIHCSSCGKEIASSARTCPNCGAKNKKPFYKTVWFWVIVVIVLAVIGGSSRKSDNDSSSNNEVTNNSSQENRVIEYQKVDIDEMEDALERNAAVAQDTYKGKYVEVTGELSTIDSKLSYIYIKSTTKDFDLTRFSCSVKNTATKDVVKTLEKGQTIVVKGKITGVGEVMGYDLDIDEIVAL